MKNPLCSKEPLVFDRDMRDIYDLMLCKLSGLYYPPEMPRKARLNAPGAVHHIIIRGIERRQIFRKDPDRVDLIQRLGRLLSETRTESFAWALIPNHADFLLSTGLLSIAAMMRPILTECAVSFNNRMSLSPSAINQTGIIPVEQVDCRGLSLCPSIDRYTFAFGIFVKRSEFPIQSRRGGISLHGTVLTSGQKFYCARSYYCILHLVFTP